jgi:predicted negative regulator of RcsB-dependent stress response
MEEKKNGPGADDDKNPKFESFANFAKYTGVAFQMVAIIGLSAFVGYKIDVYYEHKVQYATAIACVIGVFLSIYQTIRQLKE